MRSRAAVAVLLALALAAPASARGRDGDGRCREEPLACGPLAVAGYVLDQRIADNIRFGQVIEVDYRTPERVPGDVASGGAWGDSGLWTGVYLGGQSFRYAVANDKLAQRSLSRGERVFWTAQRDQAYARVKRTVAQYHLLVNIGREWKTTFAPDPTGTPPSFGGGVLQGEQGLLMRACAPDPATTPDGIGIAPKSNKRVFGPFRWEDGVDYYCETAPSRDTYAGTTFGLMLAFDLVGAKDTALRDTIRADMLTLATRLVKYGWSFPRPHGNVSLPVPAPIPGGNGHDFDNFASPTFMQQVPLARLNIAQSARHVASSGTAQEQATWNAVWAEEAASQLPALGASMEFDSVQPNDGYYKFNLHHLTGFTTVRLEPDPTVREALKAGLAPMDKTTRDDVNAHFETITYALTGEASRRSDAVTHLGEWLSYRRATHAGPVANSPRCGTEIECVPADQLEVVVAGADPVVIPGTKTNLRARTPLPVALRPPTDFLWQRPPTQLDGSEGPTHQTPGVDYLTPYWMLRYYTEVAEPDLAPFPAWPGPAHR
ncbi:MAG: hypothetical protein QOE45_629 [Frankiaceae bacterium]|nr:hypothetical protein [Frankiaceae bacterium]